MAVEDLRKQAKEWRARTGKTHEEVSSLLGYKHRSGYANFESGQSDMSVAKAETLRALIVAESAPPAPPRVRVLHAIAARLEAMAMELRAEELTEVIRIRNLTAELKALFDCLSEVMVAAKNKEKLVK